VLMSFVLPNIAMCLRQFIFIHSIY